MDKQRDKFNVWFNKYNFAGRAWNECMFDAWQAASQESAPVALPVTVRFALSEAQKATIRRAADALEDLDYEDTAGDLRAIISAMSQQGDGNG